MGREKIKVPVTQAIMSDGDNDSLPLSPAASGDETAPAISVARGLLPDGRSFLVPETMSVMHALVSVRSLGSTFTQLWVLLCVLTGGTYVFWSQYFNKWFFVAQFVFWRLAYNVGLGYLLHMQSNHRSFERFFEKHVQTRPWLLRMFERSVVLEDPAAPKYAASQYPLQFNAWMLYRFVVNIVLPNDLVSYLALVLYCWHAPDFFGDLLDIPRYIVGIGLCVFALWSKSDAHRVIGEYAWYWGDFFFLLDKSLVFDGIFQMFPHPMYTVGYAFIYGFTLMAKSYTVFYLSLFSQLCQVVFLAFAENPHIDKTYNAFTAPSEEEARRDALLYSEETGYFQRRKELIGLWHLDIRRSSDLALVLLVLYVSLSAFVDLPAWVFIAQAVIWRVVHTVAIGWVLNSQSASQRWTKQFSNARDAFENWKSSYNLTLTMVRASYIVCSVRVFQWTTSWIERDDARLAIFVVGAVLVLINIYVMVCSFEAVGEFGYFYGDFFIDNVPTKLNYGGIYRYLNNPDSSLGFAGYYGVALMSGNVVMLPVAVFSQLCEKAFEWLVERPHIVKKYGPQQVRRQGGLQQEIRIKARSLTSKVREKKTEYEASIRRLREEIEAKTEAYEKLRALVGSSPSKSKAAKERREE